MALADFLGNVGAAMGGNPALSRELAMNDVAFPTPGFNPAAPDPRQSMPQEPPQRPSARKKGVRHFLGQLGDALLIGSGAEPIYGPSIEREEMGEALATYLGNTDAALADIMRRDPATGLALLKMKGGAEGFSLSPGQIRYGPNGEIIAQAPGRDATDDPTFIRELEQLGIDPRSQEALELYYARNSPAGYLVRPPTGRSGAAGNASSLPRVSSPEEARRLAPGTQFLLPDGRVGTVPGGAASNGSGGFPR